MKPFVKPFYFKPLSELIKTDDKLLSPLMKDIKQQAKIKIFIDDSFNVNDYIIDECEDMRHYRLIFNKPHLSNPFNTNH